MISNQILQSTIEGLKGIGRIDLCVLDAEGKILASTFKEQEDFEGVVGPFIDSPADSQVIRGHQFFKVYDETQLEYILVANGGSDDVCPTILISSKSSLYFRLEIPVTSLYVESFVNT